MYYFSKKQSSCCAPVATSSRLRQALPVHLHLHMQHLQMLLRVHLTTMHPVPGARRPAEETVEELVKWHLWGSEASAPLGHRVNSLW